MLPGARGWQACQPANFQLSTTAQPDAKCTFVILLLQKLTHNALHIWRGSLAPPHARSLGTELQSRFYTKLLSKTVNVKHGMLDSRDMGI